MEQAQFEEASADLQEALSLFRLHLEPDHRRITAVLYEMAVALELQARATWFTLALNGSKGRTDRTFERLKVTPASNSSSTTRRWGGSGRRLRCAGAASRRCARAPAPGRSGRRLPAWRGCSRTSGAKARMEGAEGRSCRAQAAQRQPPSWNALRLCFRLRWD